MFESYSDFKGQARLQLGLTDKNVLCGLWGAYLKEGSPISGTFKGGGKEIIIYQREFKWAEPPLESQEQVLTADRPFDLVVAEKYINKHKNASKRGIEFTLTLSDMKRIMSRKTCYYTGIRLTKACGIPPGPTDVTLDRIDPEKGYTKENTVACCHAVNQLKAKLERDDEEGLTLKHKLKLMTKLVEVL